MAASKGRISGNSRPGLRHPWVVFGSLGMIAWLLLVSGLFGDVRRRRDLPDITPELQYVNSKTSRRGRHPSDIDCEEVGVQGKFITAPHQYHDHGVREQDKHSCRSRYQQHCLWKASSSTPSSEYLGVLRTYEENHRKCVEGHDLQDLLARGATSQAAAACKYLVWNNLDGKGNQLISLVSAFVYALLTNRVLLITREAQLQHLLCEPFPHSSWLVPEGVAHARHRAKEERHGHFYQRALNDSIQGNQNQIPTHLVIFLSNLQQPDDLRFFCEGEQKLVEKVPWVFFWSNQYSVPGLYFVPSFRAKLNSWFPDRAVFLHAGRYLLNPQDDIWLRIMRIYKAHMASADRRVGIQIRAWSNEYKPIITEHIVKCAWYSGLLPKVTNSSFASSNLVEDFSTAATGEHVSVVVTSLRREYAEGMAEIFADGRAQNQERVTVLSPSSEGEQQTGQLPHERKAISDMWLLSFTDEMVTSPRSTFGYIAHGLAGMKPIVFARYGLDKDNVPDPPCYRTNLPGPCFIDHPNNMLCPLDKPATKTGDASTSLPEVRHCILQWGVGVFEDFDEFPSSSTQGST